MQNSFTAYSNACMWVALRIPPRATMPLMTVPVTVTPNQ